MEDIDDINIICEECGVLNTNETVCVHYSTEENVNTTEWKPGHLCGIPGYRFKADQKPLEMMFLLGDGYSIENLQKKWKHLRDTYIRAKSEQNAYVPSGSATKKRKKSWKYFDLMTFLSKTVAPRSTISNLKSCSPLPSPDSGNSTSSISKAAKTVEHQIIQAINKLPPPSALFAEKKINPVCIQLSNIFEQLPSRKRN
ncbi:hypothetical protein RN001_005613 [Aquatica leii]|uniref:MADF domain-containing protein n=1 Tax=Aquatica leii TaxID=1421715 RepID=A0AAN7PCL4_9COLE|nr:hypothetical protein RN001_005613 [Aquatica leii]